MSTLFIESKDTKTYPIGKGFRVQILSELEFYIYRNGSFLRHVCLRDKYERKIFICQLVKDYKLVKLKTATAFGIDERTLRNWLGIFNAEGALGLQNCTKEGVGRKPKIVERPQTPMVKRISANNKLKKEEYQITENERKQAIADSELKLDFEADEAIESKLYSEEYPWEENRYGGAFLYLSFIEERYKFIRILHWLLGENAMIMLVFIVMQVFEIQSLEQLKTEYKGEFGKIVGIKTLYSLPILWEKIQQTVKARIGAQLKNMIFKTQQIKGFVCFWHLFIDGHNLSYTGKENVHLNYVTQVREMRPGQNEIFIHDINGRIVYFDIQEGKGDMLGVIKEKTAEYSAEFNGIPPLFIADRELWGVKRFNELSAGRFITWEKGDSKEELDGLSAHLFSLYLHNQGTDYGLYEMRKTYKDVEGNSIELRRIIIWNTKTKVRSAAVTNDKYESTQTLAAAMVNRWGKSENSFKHIENRFNSRYNPTAKTFELSENQTTSNPKYIKIAKKIQQLKKQLSKQEQKLGAKKRIFNKNGKIRKNASREKLTEDCQQKRVHLAQLQEDIKTCPEKVTTYEITNCKPYKKRVTEGKTLWDICLTLVWNSRKEMEKILAEFIPNQRDRLPVLDAITNAGQESKIQKNIFSSKSNRLKDHHFIKRSYNSSKG